MTTTRDPRPAVAVAADGSAQPADVFVAFGITGDLAKVMTLRSLYRLERRGLLNCPIVGVGVGDWTVEERASAPAPRATPGGRRPARPPPRRDRRRRRDARPRGIRALRGPPVIRRGRLRGRRDV